MITVSTCVAAGGGGRLKFGFGRDMLLGIWKWTHIYTNFPRKSDPFTYQLAWFRAKFLTSISWFFFLSVSYIWANFDSNFVCYKGSEIHKEAHYTTHVGGTSPWDLLYQVLQLARFYEYGLCWTGTLEGYLSCGTPSISLVCYIRYGRKG